MKTVVKMRINSEKKHSVRYDGATLEDMRSITTLYVMKDAISKPYPIIITVTIESE